MSTNKIKTATDLNDIFISYDSLGNVGVGAYKMLCQWAIGALSVREKQVSEIIQVVDEKTASIEDRIKNLIKKMQERNERNAAEKKELQDQIASLTQSKLAAELKAEVAESRYSKYGQHLPYCRITYWTAKSYDDRYVNRPACTCGFE